MSNKRGRGSIDPNALPVNDDETLIRLLCSPLYYDAENDLVNNDAFDLRILKSGKLETYVSLARLKMFSSQDEINQYLSSAGYKMWDDKDDCEQNYYGYGVFNCGDAREVHDMIEVNPVNEGAPSHIGLFYKDDNGSYFKGPLPKNEIINEVLSDLAELLEVKKAPQRADSIKV